LGDADKAPDDVLKKTFQSALREPQLITLLIIEENETPIGFANLMTIFSVWSHGKALILDDLYIKKEHRGKGYGREAMAYVETYAKSNGYNRLQFQSELSNPDAKKFYEALGFAAADMYFYVKYLTNNKKTRCSWAENDEKMSKYHDEVWGVPVHDDQKLFAKLSLDLMQAGLNWRTILYKQENFEKAFDDFHIETVAGYSEEKFDELMKDAGIVRNRLKIRAIINNASRTLEVQKEFGSFDAYLWSFSEGEVVKNRWRTIDEIPASSPLSDAISKDLKKRGFRFVGSTIIYAYLQAVGVVNDHLTSCFCYQR